MRVEDGFDSYKWTVRLRGLYHSGRFGDDFAECWSIIQDQPNPTGTYHKVLSASTPCLALAQDTP
jgi:hypothetical protein